LKARLLSLRNTQSYSAPRRVKVAHGREGLREFFERIYRRPHTYGWTWDDMTVDGDDGLLWFVAPATVVIRQDDGSETVAPYRLSGVLRRGRDDDWLFALFNGSEPTVPT
jgi:ketosteroid isomerase-like protein